MAKMDRRVERTRKQLQKALIELMNERGYDKTTIQDIVERANIGRTTFYLHYKTKDELFIDCHKSMVNDFYSGLLYSHTLEELLSPEVPQGMVEAYRHLQDGQSHLYSIFQSKESLNQIHKWNTQQIENNLRANFSESDALIPFDILANYLAGAQIALMQWWLEKRRSSTPEILAKAFHRLQRAAIRDAFQLRDKK